MTLLTWAERSRERFSWAERAHEAFLGSLHEALARMYRALRDEATVVVFGSTQVGKTTLILRLLGVDEDRLEEVSKVLRAGRAHGRSSTATAMLYGRALDDRWHLLVAGIENSFQEPTPIEEELRRLRDRVEREGLDLPSPVRLLLPEHCFSASHSFHKRVNVIDLPGDNPSNERERGHVQKMAELYVPNADLVILVGKVDDLGFIDPDKLSLPNLCEWHYQPGRYRIVTTYTIQAASFRTWLEGQDRIDVRILRQRLLEQLQTFDEVKIPDDARNEAIYFPLEFGQSWRELERTAPGTHAKVRPVMDELTDKLRRDIDESTTPRMRILRAREVHILANKLKRDNQKKEEERIRQVRRQANLHLEKAEELRAAARRFREKAEALPHAHDIKSATLKIDQRLRTEIPIPAAEIQDGKRVSYLKEGIARIEDSLIEMAQSFQPAPAKVALDARTQTPALNRIRDRVAEEFEPLEDRLRYWTDLYLRSGSWEKDREELRTRAVAATHAVRDELRTHWITQLREFAKRTEEKHRRLTKFATDAKLGSEAEFIKASELATKARLLEVELDTLLRQLEEDEAKGRRFEEMLGSAFRAQRDALVEEVSQPRSAVSRFLGLLSLRQIRFEYDDLFVRASLTNTATTQRA